MVFLRRANSPTCFYCLSAPTAAPVDPRSFRCPHCGCWNRYDANGDISSDEPAMHDENLNTASFAMRASPNTDRLPSTYARPPFCHTCQTNQMLLVNLLSNYLPPPHHPDYAQRLEQLPAYRASLHARYPPVCASCLPAVEDQIEQKNHMARTMALGGWLRDSKGKENQRPAAGRDRERLGVQLAIWRLRGVLWAISFLSVVLAHAAAIRGYDFPHSLAGAIPMFPAFSLFSLFYTAWDPTYYRFQRARVQGRDVRISGKPRYIILQLLAWFSRLATSILLFLSSQSLSWDYLDIAAYPSSHRVSVYCTLSLIVELLVFTSSFTILHLQRPPTIRLVATSPTSSVRGTPESSVQSARTSPIPVTNEPDLLASLTLSPKPLISTNPMFGHPSLAPSLPVSTAPPASSMNMDKTADEDAMDWTPTNPSPVKAKKADDGAWLRPQRFFPPERPTGLESLFASTKLDDGGAHSTTNALRLAGWNGKAIWWTAAITVIVVLTSVVYHWWTKGWIQ